MVFFLFKRRTFFLMLGTLVLLVVAKTTWHSFLAGLPLVFVGEVVRMWSAGCLRKMDQLITAGPFALCRNPLYVGSFLMMLGYLVMCWRVDAAMIGVVLFWLFHGGAITHEEGMLRDKFGQPFIDYCKSVPALFPCLNFKGCRGGFSWALVKENSEHRAVISALVVVALFGLIACFGSPLELVNGR